MAKSARNRGACIVEYVLLVALIAFSVIGAEQYFAKNTSKKFQIAGCAMSMDNSGPVVNVTGGGTEQGTQPPKDQAVDCKKLLAPPKRVN